MDLAITIFWIGVGIGALLVGIGVIMMAVSLRPVARDTRALANDARRLTRLAESELANMAGRTREMADGAEELTTDLANELHALRAQTDALEQRVLGERPIMAAPVTVASPIGRPHDDPMGRQPIGSVQSPHAREDEQIP
ncbi:MAG TPA: hypothetical protein VIH33_08775 [Candidatus Limnocylindria bacterium]|jgi:hypothetical protein